MDEEGYLYFIGRSDEIIKSRGEKVAPKEVENVLVNIPGVKEAAVVGVADELLGQAVKAFVVIEQGHIVGERQLQMECQRRLENFMVPKSIVIVPSLPRTDTGKLKKVALS
ncbi:AMP-binding enzyme [Mesorhizobium atlanticum]